MGLVEGVEGGREVDLVSLVVARVNLVKEGVVVRVDSSLVMEGGMEKEALNWVMVAVTRAAPGLGVWEGWTAVQERGVGCLKAGWMKGTGKGLGRGNCSTHKHNVLSHEVK